jgi:hypothetical protein
MDELRKKVDEWNRGARDNQGEKRERSRQAWEPGWEDRIYQFIRTLGCSTVNEFLKLFPGEPYVALTRRLAVPIVPVHLIEVGMKEAVHNGALRDAAMDALARCLNRSVPGGWGTASNADFEHTDAFCDWVRILRFRAGKPELEPTAKRVFEFLQKLPPPAGWRPSGAEDPLIRSAFALGWPEGHNG